MDNNWRFAISDNTYAHLRDSISELAAATDLQTKQLKDNISELAAVTKLQTKLLNLQAGAIRKQNTIITILAAVGVFEAAALAVLAVKLYG